LDQDFHARDGQALFIDNHAPHRHRWIQPDSVIGWHRSAVKSHDFWNMPLRCHKHIWTAILGGVIRFLNRGITIVVRQYGVTLLFATRSKEGEM
jgi:hypothetical protein